MSIFTEAYKSQQRDRQQFGMDNSDDQFSPERNPYNHLDDEDLNDIHWDDDGPSDDEDEDAMEDEAEGEMGDTRSRSTIKGIGEARRLTCSKCGEAARVTPPEGYSFAKRAAEDEDGARDTDYHKVRWACQHCGKWNTGTVTPRSVSRASASESADRAISTFREKYSAEPHTPDASLDAVSTFRESYGVNNDLALWRECVRRHGG